MERKYIDFWYLAAAVVIYYSILRVTHVSSQSLMPYGGMESGVSLSGSGSDSGSESGSGSGSGSESTITVRNNSFSFQLPQYVVEIQEGATGIQNILNVTASDRDFPDVDVTYRLISDGIVEDFVIHNGIILVNSDGINREERDTYEFTIEAMYTLPNGSVVTTSASLIVNVIDVNDESPRFQPPVRYIVSNITTRNDVGDFVVRVSATDSDLGSNGDVTYHLDDNSTFAINRTSGGIRVASSLNPRRYSLTVYATDNGDNPLSTSTTVDIFVQPSPNRIQLSLTENPINIAEDVPIGSLIGQVSALVIDHSNAALNSSDVTVTYEIVNGSDPSRFTIGSTSGDIFSLVSLDYDALAREYDLIVRATLNGIDLTEEVIVIVMVENIDDNPPLFIPEFYAISIEQFTVPGTTILSVYAIDPDNLETIQYSLAGPDNDLFQINASSGVISAAVDLDEPRDFRFSAVASDGGKVDSIAIVYVSVTRSVSIALRFTRTRFIFPLSENASPGTFVGKVTAVTVGNRSSEEFSHLGFRITMPDSINSNGTLTNDSSQNLFHIDTVSGNISTQAIFEFDVESREDYVFYVEVYNLDGGNVYDTALVDVRLQDENDNPPVFDQSLYTRVINTSQRFESTVIVLLAEDRDSGTNQLISYDLEERNPTLGFALNSSSGALSVSNSTLIPGDYYVSVIASDGGEPQMTASARVFIAVIPADPENIEFTDRNYNFEVSEDAPPDTLIGTITVVETNTSLISPTAIYSTPNVTQCFSVDSQSGRIRVSCTTLDRDTVPNYELLVTARVNDVVAYGTVKISLLDVNDNAPVFSRDVYTAVVDDRHGNATAVIQVVANDSDNGRNSTISYETVPSNNDIFRIDATTGEVFLIDEDVQLGGYRLVVQATDMGVPTTMSSSSLVLVSITRAHPQTLQFANLRFNVSENIPPGSIVGTVVLTTDGGGNIIDPDDFPDNLEFLIVGGDSSDLFSVDSSTGVITTLTRNIDREEGPSHVIILSANFVLFTNIPVQNVTSTFTIDVLDVNDVVPTLDSIIYNTVVDDSAETNQVLFNIRAIDRDILSNGRVSFSINPDPPSLFGVRVTDASIYPYTDGEIFINDTNLLVPRTYRFTLTATDDGSPPTNSMSTVDIIVNHAIPESIAFSSENYTFTVLEGSPDSTLIGNVTVTPDTPALDPLVYDIVSGNGLEYFIINTRGMILKNHREIDREVNNMFVLNLRAYLPNQNPPLLTADTTVTIIVEDVNDNLPTFQESSYPNIIGVVTGEINTAVPLLTVSVTDADIGPNGEIDLEIASITLGNQTEHPGAGNALFILQSSGELFIRLRDIPVDTYLLYISATDNGSPQLSGYTTVTVVVQRPAPDSISFANSSGYAFRLSENQGATLVSRVFLESIPDYLTPFVSYSISDETDFTILPSGGDIIARRGFDYEEDESFSFVITAHLNTTSRTPDLYLATSVNVTVLILDENDNTPYFIDFPSVITQYEERPSTEIVYNISASDLDAGSNARLGYEIINANLNGLLSIDSTTGALSAAANLDREDREQGIVHWIVIRVCDMGGSRLCVDNATRFSLLDINDNNPELLSGLSYQASERIPLGTEVFTFTGRDLDAVGDNSTIRYFITSQGVPFECDNATGRVTLTEELDYEITSSYSVTILLTDLGTPVLTSAYTVTVNVIDRPDSNPQFVFRAGEDSYTNTTDPEVNVGDILFQVRATDDDNDSLVYAIINVQVMSNNNMQPNISMESSTGNILSGVDQEFIPEASFTITVIVYDQSMYNLSNTTTLTITVVPDPLAFTEDEYTTMIPEDALQRTTVMVLPIQRLSISSNIQYSFDVIEPSLSGVTFSSSGNGATEVTITVAVGAGLDRENIDRYVLEVRATRPEPSDMTQTRLVVTVTDVNDNTPQFVDREGTVLTVPEGSSSQSLVTLVEVTDQDMDENARLVFTLDPNDLPFVIDPSTGVIRTVGGLDYETTPSYNVTVRVQDSGQPIRSNQLAYRINLLNVNDNFAEFSALSYFGEIYARAPAGDYVRFTEIGVTDRDDPDNQQALIFRIYPEDPSKQDYRFRVDSGDVHRIVVDHIPEEADDGPQLLVLRLEVADEGGKISAPVPLFISIFTSNNLAFFNLQGVSRENLITGDCTSSSSMCSFLQAVGDVTRDVLASRESFTTTTGRISFYNNTVDVSPVTPQTITVGAFGWYDSNMNYSRDMRGELHTNDQIEPVRYITYDEEVFKEVAESNDLAFLTFAVKIQEKVPPTVVSASPTLPIPVLVGVGGGVVVVVLVVFLIVVIVCVCGRRGKDQPKKKKKKKKKKGKTRRSSDPYERDINRFHHLRKMKGYGEDIPLQSTGQSDLAYETMYDDDDILDTAQTMPWFDPKYLASGKDEYDGDSEHTLQWAAGDRQGVPFNLRATVDGDARREKRRSLDDSVIKDPSVAEYLRGYQNSTPSQPGQRMGDYDMFASPRTDQPYRPSLEHAQNHWRPQPQQQQPQASRGPLGHPPPTN